MEKKLTELEQKYETLLQKYMSIDTLIKESQIKTETLRMLENRIQVLEKEKENQEIVYSELIRDPKIIDMKNIHSRMDSIEATNSLKLSFDDVLIKSILNKILTIEDSLVIENKKNSYLELKYGELKNLIEKCQEFNKILNKKQTFHDILINSIVNKVEVIESSHKQTYSLNDLVVRSFAEKIDSFDNLFKDENKRNKELQIKYDAIRELVDKSLLIFNSIKEKQSFDDVMMKSLIEKVVTVETSNNSRANYDGILLKSLINRIDNIESLSNQNNRFDENLIKNLIYKTETLENSLNEDRVRFKELEDKFLSLKGDSDITLNSNTAKVKSPFIYEKIFPSLAKSVKIQQSNKNNLRRINTNISNISKFRSPTISPLNSISIDISQSLFYKTLTSNSLFKELILNKKILFIFKASLHDFSAKKFHEICDNKANTIVFVKANTGKVFGGYTNCEWTSSQNKLEDTDNLSFLFSIDRNIILPLINLKDMTILCQANYGPTFGTGYDLYLCDECHVKENSSSFIGNSFISPPNLNLYEKKVFLADRENFKVDEYEVFQLK
jgi:hypothetical protein